MIQDVVSEKWNLIFWSSFLTWTSVFAIHFPGPFSGYCGEVSTAVFNENQLKSNIAENVTGFPNTDYESPPYQAQIGL